MIISLVILNYNDEETTKICVENAKKIEKISQIIIVDNHSNTYQTLQNIANGNIYFIRTEKNLGYAGGNNVGIKYAIEHFNADYIMIANPDVLFDDIVVEKSLEVFSKYIDAGVVACRMKTKRMYEPARKLPNYVQLLLSNFPLIGQINSIQGYPASYFSAPVCEVGQVWGSLFMISRRAFVDIDGLDESTFLYFEEAILGKRLQLKKYKTYLITNVFFQHSESTSIKKSITSSKERMKILYCSQRVYAKKYLKIGKFKFIVLRLTQFLSLRLYSVYWRIKSYCVEN